MEDTKRSDLAEETPFFDRVTNSFNIVSHSIKAIMKYPVFLIPIFISWVFYAVTIIYFKYYFNWKVLSIQETFITVFNIIFSFCLVFSIGCLILLEFMQQIETGRRIRVFRAIKKVLIYDIVKALPIILIWAVIWFVLATIEAIFRRKGEDNDDSTLSYENVANVLSGYKDFSIAGLSFDLIQSGVRLVAFFIYPAIVWEDETPVNAIKKGLSVIKNNVVEFATGFMLTETAAAIIFLPPCLLRKFHIHLPDKFYIIVIIYIACAWSLYLYLQQMFAALFYMWNMKWIRAVEKAKKKNLPIPKLKDVNPPNLLDDIPDLLV